MSSLVDQHVRRRRRQRGRWVAVALLSLLAHALVIGALVLENALNPPAPVITPQAVALRPITPQEWERRRGFRLPPDSRPRPPDAPGQVVEVAPGNGESSPAARFLAESNNRVQRETRSRVTTPHPGSPTPPQPPAPPPPPAEAAPAPEHRVPNLIPDFSPLDLGPSPRANQPMAGGAFRPPAAERPGEPGAFNDDLGDLPEGDGTFLNTREWRYAGFFNRLKEGVSGNWHPREVMIANRHLNDPVSRVTVVAVTIDEQGAVRDVQVVRPCGFSPLDEEAVQAFRRSGPFPNPPAGLFEGGDTYTFPFGFHVDMRWPSAASIPRLRRR
ncbi:MAG TPA: TonB family protein [Myxococcaceae bacterium]|jgi:TonB family protein